MNDRKNSAVPALAPTRRQMMIGTAVALGGLAAGSVFAWAETEEGISHTAESIHQETVFGASPKRVYDALTRTVQFDKVVRLSAAMNSGMKQKLGAEPTRVNPVAGGAFALFGGYVTGRQVELVPNQRIVQAWRAGSWAPGVYSIAKFELTPQGSGTKLIFDHTGFPPGEAQHLAEGWKGNYWEPLAKYLR